jgi:hypothetical protein
VDRNGGHVTVSPSLRDIIRVGGFPVTYKTGSGLDDWIY